jgi:hypothetical protein
MAAVRGCYPVTSEIRALIERLRESHIPVFYVRTRGEARKQVLSMIPVGSVVGFGDSVTLREIGVVDALSEGAYTFLNPWAPNLRDEERIALKRRALTADVFVTGTNAITVDGKIVNIDGHGNRVAAICFGPEQVIIVVGINKIVPDLESALARIRNTAAPLNVRRHPEFDPAPPCATTGVCCDCDSPWRICNKTLIIEGQYDNDTYRPVLSVILVGEELGL